VITQFKSVWPKLFLQIGRFFLGIKVFSTLTYFYGVYAPITPRPSKRMQFIQHVYLPQIVINRILSRKKVLAMVEKANKNACKNMINYAYAMSAYASVGD